MTAIFPLPFIYTLLSISGVRVPLSDEGREKGSAFAQRVTQRWPDIQQRLGSDTPTVVLNMATSYAIVKMALPVRLALSAWLTPWLARRVILPASRIFRIKQ